MADPTSGLIPGSGPALAKDIGDFPFRVEFSLAPLIDFWARARGDDSAACSSMARAVGEQLAQVPGVEQSITDPAILERYEDAVDMLMSAEIPPAAWEHAYAAAMIPFQLRGFYATPRMRQDMLDEGGRLKGRLNIDDKLVGQLRRGYAYMLVLHRVYGVTVELDYTPTLTVPDRETGLDRHFRLLFDSQFVDVEVVGERPPLPDAVRQRLQATLLEPGAMERILPPDRFVLRGVTFLKAIDVTDQEVLSALKRDLIDRESIVSPTRFAELQVRLRTLLRRPGLNLGLAALAGERVLLLNYGAKIEHACIFADSVHHRKEDFVGTVYQRAVTSGKPLIVDDLSRLPSRTLIEDQMVAAGLRGFLVAPLHYQDRIIGTLELSSPRPDDLDASHLPKLAEVLPLFSMAVQRSMDEFNARIQTQIKERFTAIHPVVEWRFRKAVLDGLERAGDPAAAELEPIVFERGLSALRALGHPRLVDAAGPGDPGRPADPAATGPRGGGERLRGAPAARARSARYRIDQHVEQIRDHLAAGDEVGVVTFLRAEVETAAGPAGHLRRRRGDPGDGVSRGARRQARHGLPAAQDLRGQRHAAERDDLLLSRAGGAGGAVDLPALLREAEDRRRRSPDLRRWLAGRGRRLRSALPQEPAPLAAHGGVRRSRPGPTASPPSFHSRCRPRTWCSCSTRRCRSASASTRSASTWTARTTSATRS